MNCTTHARKCGLAVQLPGCDVAAPVAAGAVASAPRAIAAQQKPMPAIADNTEQYFQRMVLK
jgi:hypothetical protein